MAMVSQLKNMVNGSKCC